MTPAEKEANQLIDKYRTFIRIADGYGQLLSDTEIFLAQQCALTATRIIKKELNDTCQEQTAAYWDVVEYHIKNYDKKKQ